MNDQVLHMLLLWELQARKENKKSALRLWRLKENLACPTLILRL